MASKENEIDEMEAFKIARCFFSIFISVPCKGEYFYENKRNG